MDRLKATIGNFRWYIATLLFSSTTLYYFDRQIFPVLCTNQTYLRELGFILPDGSVDARLFSYIDWAHKIAYAIGFLLMGRFVDWVGLKRGFAVGVGIWSLAALSCAFWHSFWPLFGGMMVLGFFQASDHPSCAKTVSAWFPASERSVAVAYYNSGTNFGAIVVAGITPVLCLWLSWPMAYIVPGVVGLVWVAVWWRSYAAPETNRFLHDAERNHIRTGQVIVPEAQLGWGRLFTCKEAWGFAAAKFFIDPVWFIFLTWLPQIFRENYGVDFRRMFAPIAIIYSVSLAGNFAGGGLSSRCLRRGWNVNRSRKLVMFFFALIPITAVIAARTSNFWLVVTIVSCVTFAHQAYSTLLITTVADVFPSQVVGSVTGFGSLFGALGGALCTLCVGVIKANFGYAPLFYFAAIAYLAGLGILHLLNPRLDPVKLADAIGAAG